MYLAYGDDREDDQEGYMQVWVHARTPSSAARDVRSSVRVTCDASRFVAPESRLASRSPRPRAVVASRLTYSYSLRQLVHHDFEG